MRKYLKFFRRINFKSIRFNLKYLPLKDALKFPFLISNNILLKEINGEVILKRPIKTGMIQLGYEYDGIALFDRKTCKGIWQVNGLVQFNGTARIGHGAKICVGPKGALTLGNNFALTAASSIVVEDCITFGADCLISWDCLFMDSDYHKIYDNRENCINEPKAITVGDKVWIGCRNLVLKGSKIANHSVIGANSVVNTALDSPSSIYAGSPARLIRKDVKWQA